MSHPSVARRFQRLVNDIAPEAGELKRVERNIAGIRSRLNATFGLARATLVGSHRKGTAIRIHSDADLFVVLRRAEIRRGGSEVGSTTVLKWVRDDLQARYPTTTVRRDGVAVVVGFGNGAFAVDVVPALFAAFQSQPIFRIPDGRGGWVPTAPDAQRAWLNAAQAASARRLVPVVRMLKWWSCARGTTSPLKSLYLETLLGRQNIVGGPWSHAEALGRAFSFMVRSGCPPLVDPIGVSPTSLAATATSNQHSVLLDAARAAHGRSLAALSAEQAGNWREAVRKWSMVFNHEFPE